MSGCRITCSQCSAGIVGYLSKAIHTPRKDGTFIESVIKVKCANQKHNALIRLLAALLSSSKFFGGLLLRKRESMSSILAEEVVNGTRKQK